MVDWISLLLGVSLTLWVVTVLGVSYVAWRYVYSPWKAVRADQVSLAAAFEDLKGYVQHEIGTRRALAYSDEEEARIERHAQARRNWARVEGGAR